jgi:hypothetical protein
MERPTTNAFFTRVAEAVFDEEPLGLVVRASSLPIA